MTLVDVGIQTISTSLVVLVVAAGDDHVVDLKIVSVTSEKGAEERGSQGTQGSM